MDLLELIYSPPDPDTLKGRASGYGTPILIPLAQPHRQRQIHI